MTANVAALQIDTTTNQWLRIASTPRTNRTINNICTRALVLLANHDALNARGSYIRGVATLLKRSRLAQEAHTRKLTLLRINGGHPLDIDRIVALGLKFIL